MTTETRHEPDAGQATLPLAEERLTIEKQRVVTGRVRVHTVIDERLARVSEDLEQEDVSIERVAVNREVTHPPEIREENGVLIVPLCEEVLVVEKRLVVKEELHIRKQRQHERFEQAVRVRGMHVEVDRLGAVPTEGSARAAENAEASARETTTTPAEPIRRRPRIRRKPPVGP